jgi:hypothetical protein
VARKAQAAQFAVNVVPINSRNLGGRLYELQRHRPGNSTLGKSPPLTVASGSMCQVRQILGRATRRTTGRR